ncbi:MAG: hypothetical protein QNJ41_08205 [Xenococcaceae cyanobacterium MO_188.B32]|nr:hypothetical protein [Xenococcaceae cyanobacterium MO_188.B32]
MLLFLILSFLLLGNWILTEVLVYIPIRLVESLNSIAQIAMVLVLVLFLAWCLGDG